MARDFESFFLLFWEIQYFSYYGRIVNRKQSENKSKKLIIYYWTIDMIFVNNAGVHWFDGRSRKRNYIVMNKIIIIIIIIISWALSFFF